MFTPGAPPFDCLNEELLHNLTDFVRAPQKRRAKKEKEELCSAHFEMTLYAVCAEKVTNGKGENAPSTGNVSK